MQLVKALTVIYFGQTSSGEDFIANTSLGIFHDSSDPNFHGGQYFLNAFCAFSGPPGGTPTPNPPPPTPVVPIVPIVPQIVFPPDSSPQIVPMNGGGVTQFSGSGLYPPAPSGQGYPLNINPTVFGDFPPGWTVWLTSDGYCTVPPGGRPPANGVAQFNAQNGQYNLSPAKLPAAGWALLGGQLIAQQIDNKPLMPGLEYVGTLLGEITSSGLGINNPAMNWAGPVPGSWKLEDPNRPGVILTIPPGFYWSRNGGVVPYPVLQQLTLANAYRMSD